MTKKEFSMFAMALKTYYPQENLLPNEQAMILWFNQLSDIPYNVAETALNKWVAVNKWSPRISEIRETAWNIIHSEVLPWGEAWEQVLRAVQKYGYYREREAMATFPELTRRAVKNLGFQNICLSENIATERANFRMIYEQLAERTQQTEVLPDTLKTAIGQLRQENHLLESHD